jgi:DNA repair exonuclease SbcCD ATPase subunit
VRIVRLRVDGFGALQGEWTFAPERLNVVLDDNERGKSSLFAAIVAALYGLEADRRSHRVLTPLERWRPWGGGAFRVTLEVDGADGRWTIHRDFDRGTVAVFDRTGSEVTADFLEGRDDYPVGKRLLGLDAAEFEKSALLLQGELDGVVPADDRTRRGSTLKGRLENAADTHIGDTNATEALKVLELALRRYDAPELEFTGTIDNAIDRLVARREAVEVELRELDATLAVAQAPLDALHQLTQEERRLQGLLRELENERRAGLAVEVRRQLADHETAISEVNRLESEAGELAGMANLPPNAEGELRESIARHEEAMRGIEGLESRRREELAREREAIAAERKELGPYDAFTPEEADRCVGQAAELRHLLMQDALLRHQVFELRDGLAGKGYDPEQAQHLQARFATLPPEKLRLLRQQGELNLLFQTEAATLEQQRTGATETLRAVDAARAARRTPGWILLALGAAGLVAGGAALGFTAATTLGVALLAAGGAVAAAGGGLLALGARTRGEERDEALATLAEAQGRLNQLHRRRAENEAGLHELGRLMGYRDHVDLLRQWNDYARMIEDAGPLVRAEEQLEAAERRRQQLMEEARALLKLPADRAVTPELLEKVAYDARRSLNARQRLADLERGFGWVEEEKRVLESAANAMKDRAVRQLQAAGIPYDPAKGWAHHVAELKRRIEGRVRYAMIVEELVPAARRRLHPEHEVAQRRRQLEMLVAGGELPERARPSGELELEVKQTRSKLEETQRRRADVRVEVEEVWRRHAQRLPDLTLAQERLGRAIERAKKFKQAVEIARETIQRVAVDTHRKWADFLNDRVGEILRSFGTSVSGVRFGEDLDFSVQLDGGPLVSRGKAHAQLSVGARDQLYLAVRLAVSEFLSRGKNPLPLLLDDVFATSDDERLRAGMRALVQGLGAGHQVLLTTCHRGRMEELKRADPELYRDRVHWVDLRAGLVGDAARPAGAKGR